MKIRTALAEDFIALSGKGPARTSRAVTVLADDGEVMGIGGVYPDSTRWVMFSFITDRLRADKRALIQAIRTLKDLMGQLPDMPIIAEADPEICGSETLLKHLGFYNVFGRIWECHLIR